MSKHLQAAGDRGIALLPPTVITAAVDPLLGTAVGISGATYLAVEAQFTYGSGGASADAYVQTSFDGGLTWIDIMDFHFTTSSLNSVSAVSTTTALAAAYTPTDGSLTANTIVSGLLGTLVRVKVITTGTYAGGTSLRVDAAAKAA